MEGEGKAKPLKEGEGIQRKYRRSHRQPIPLLDEKNMLMSNKLTCSNIGCENHLQPPHPQQADASSFNFSVLVECWKCKLISYFDVFQTLYYIHTLF